MLEAERLAGKAPEALTAILNRVGDGPELLNTTQFGSCVFANKPGDGSAREQAASCQKVLADLLIYATILPLNATALTASIGVFCLLPWMKVRPSPMRQGTLCSFPTFAALWMPVWRISPAKVIRKDGNVDDIFLHIRG